MLQRPYLITGFAFWPCLDLSRPFCHSMPSPWQTRMTLVSMGYFGDAKSPLRDLLQRAFEMFTAWRKQKGIPCSQKRFTPKLVVKAMHGHYMTAKAYNGRVLLEWLAEVSREVAAQDERKTDQRISLQAVALTLSVANARDPKT